MALKTWIFVGASGRVGQMLMKHWQDEMPDNLRIIPQSRDIDLPDAVIWSPLDGPDALVAWVKENGPIDGMFSFAGVTPGPNCVLSDNAALAQACLSAASAVAIPSVLFASSSAVYGVGDGTPMKEDTALNPVNDYGRAKVDAETVCSEWRDKGINVTVLRIGNVAGADALLSNVAKANQSRSLKLDIFKNGGGPRRSYIGPVTLAEVLVTLANKNRDLPHVINLGAPTSISMESLLSQTDLPWNKVLAPETAHQDILLDCSLLESLFSFSKKASDASTMLAEWYSLRDTI